MVTTCNKDHQSNSPKLLPDYLIYIHLSPRRPSHPRSPAGSSNPMHNAQLIPQAFHQRQPVFQNAPVRPNAKSTPCNLQIHLLNNQSPPHLLPHPIPLQLLHQLRVLPRLLVDPLPRTRPIQLPRLSLRPQFILQLL